MLKIILTPEQAKLVATARKPVQVCDPEGNVLAQIDPVWTDDDLAEAEKALTTNQVWYTTEQVLAHLQSLEQK
jgi:hypothetical protein